MKIGIDARFLTYPQPGGFKTYTENLIMALAGVDSENEYILYLDRPPCSETKLPNRPNFSNRIVPGQVPILGMPWREQVSLVRQADQDKLDLFHAPNLTAPLRLVCRLAVTIRDIIWYCPERFSKGKAWSLQRQLMEYWVPQLAIRNAAAILTVSQAAKESIVQYLGLAADRVFVTHEAVSPIFRRVDNDQQVEMIRRKYNLVSEFILVIGLADPRKNISTLVLLYNAASLFAFPSRL